MLAGCDLGGFNIQRFDLPVLMAEGRPQDIIQVIMVILTIFPRGCPCALAASFGGGTGNVGGDALDWGNRP